MIQPTHKNQPPATKKTFVVDSTNISERGTVFPCKILNEIATIIDELLKQHFGFLNYDEIATQSYHVHITGQAFINDEIELAWEVLSSDEARIELLVFADRKVGKTWEPVADGTFIFRLAKTENDVKPLNSSLHLFTSYN